MIIYYIIFIFGAVIGSFFNVCIYRIPRGGSIAFPPSHCTNCKKEIKWYDLIPIISYIFLRGKCRYCKEKIPIRYPMIEFTTALLFVANYSVYGLTFDFIKYTTLLGFLIVIGMIDCDTTDVYFSTTLSGIISGIIFIGVLTYNMLPVKSYIYGGVLGGGFLALIILITKGGMGWGDAEMCLMSGLFIGLKLTTLMLLLSFIIGSISALTLILLGKKSRKDYIPFGPYIALSSILCVLAGEKIFSFYMSLIF
ncbi:prepilin peptidase [Clostridium sp. OS1-26]|uniref:prepilin peptidase n=1 Tax=Clostridium sp. OS1-26 TaxID=3070681 RepID=UPI0027E130FD|nr:prepilin peptidase [Clostridium sp. OS1-26]WML36046.1 prepilin peptidase [Clostridium sp. OS1-26]